MPLECDFANSRTTSTGFSRRGSNAARRTPRHAELRSHRHARARTGHGFIRLTSTRKVFFHRSDLCEGTSFADLAVGNRVTFELLEDAISGPRALRVERFRAARSLG